VLLYPVYKNKPNGKSVVSDILRPEYSEFLALNLPVLLCIEVLIWTRVQNGCLQ
jgi:hypothetical protein